MFNLNYDNVIAWLLPKIIRRPVLFNYLKALILPVKRLYNKFSSYRDENIYKLNHNGQTCYLEGALNDAFDVALRRIEIIDAGGSQIVPLFPDSDLKPVSLDDDLTGCIVLQPDSGYTNGSYDFVVKLPYVYSAGETYRIRSLVDYYKLAGKRYDLIY